MKKRYKIDTDKVLNYEKQRVVAFVGLLGERNPDKRLILVFIETLAIKAEIPQSMMMDEILDQMEAQWEDFVYNFMERSGMNEEDAHQHADVMIKEAYPEEYEILKRDYPDRYKD